MKITKNTEIDVGTVVVQNENVTRWNCTGVTPNDFCSFAERLGGVEK